MSDLRGFSIVRQAVDLETIEEEPDDYHSQHSRAGARSLRNGIEGVVGAGHVRRGSKSGAEWGAEGQGRQPPSQTNTITTYATQYSDCFDVNAFSGLQQQQQAKSGVGAAQGAVGLVRVKRHRFDDDHNLLLEEDLRGTIGTVGTGGTTTTATSAQHDSGAGKRLRADKWDQNYYYNNYGPSPGDPLQVYKWSNSQNWTAAQRRLVRERQQQEQRSRRRRRCCNCSVM